MSTASRIYDTHALVAADYSPPEPPMKVVSYNPAQVQQIEVPCIYPRYDDGLSDYGREFWLEKGLIDPYDLAAMNGSNRTQVIDNSLTGNTFATFLPGETKWTLFVTELTGKGLPLLGNKGGDYSQVMQWKSIRADGSGSDPFLAITEAGDGLNLHYNSVQYWNSAGQPERGVKRTWPIPGDFKGHQIKLVLQARFGDASDGGFRLLGELTGNSRKGLVMLVSWQNLPTLSPRSPGATLSWGIYQEAWLPSVTRCYWDVEVMA